MLLPHDEVLGPVPVPADRSETRVLREQLGQRRYASNDDQRRRLGMLVKYRGGIYRQSEHGYTYHIGLTAGPL